MRLFFRFAAIYLAAFWVPAAMCCNLESLGVSELCPVGEKQCCADADEPAENTACNPVEAGHVQPSLGEIKVSAPMLTVNVWADVVLAALADAIAPVEPPTDYSACGQPEDWVPRWSFDRRAAAPAHAPDEQAS